MQEIWKDIQGYEGRYQISNLGNVLALNYKRSQKPQILRHSISYDGYHRVNLCKGSRRQKKSISVHILVAKAFIPNPENKPQVNHIDGNKDNNSFSNLEWVTGKENIQHAIKNGLRNKKNYIYLKGSSHYASKPVLQYDLNGNFIKKWDCQSDAARFYNCRPSTIVNCSKNRIKTCKGFIWRFFDGDIKPKISVVHTNYSPRIIRQYSIDGSLIREWRDYNEIKSVFPEYKKPSLSACCNGKQKSAYGYIWKYQFI